MGAAFLFLFLRRRKRKHHHRGSETSSMHRLKSGNSDADSEGCQSRRLSSTWSWFGSVAIDSGSESDNKIQHGPSPYRDSINDDTHNIPETEQGTNIGEWVAHARMALAVSPDTRTLSPLLQESEGENGGDVHVRPASTTDISVSTLRFDPPREAKGKGIRAQNPRDLPPVPAIARVLTTPSLTSGGARMDGN
uniref:Plp n=1 Tax=Ganoderma boninense TaxID=34458 RepID=A0A5K1JYZ9_9APHY|nr:Plp [Ganoderma boninense]